MKLLIINNEPETARNVRNYFGPNGFCCEHASDMVSASQKLALYEYDCILLEMNPQHSCIPDFITKVRDSGKSEGIIVISPNDDLESKISSLKSGADDFISKPFHLSEILARVEALIRRRRFLGHPIVKTNGITINLSSKSVEANGHNPELSRKEMDLFLFLIANKNRVVSKSAIAEYLSGEMADMLESHQFVYAHIKNLKKKLAPSGASRYLTTVYGFGYKWIEE